jgi:hypothetical protein
MDTGGRGGKVVDGCRGMGSGGGDGGVNVHWRRRRPHTRLTGSPWIENTLKFITMYEEGKANDWK